MIADMSEDPLPADEALAALMSIERLDERRQFIADDLDAGRRFSSINRLTLALVLGGAEQGVRPLLELG